MVKLQRIEREDGSLLMINAYRTAAGGLRIEGYDLGPVAEIMSPDGEYEWAYTYRPDDVPAIVDALGGEEGDDVLALLAERWSGEATNLITRVLRAKGVDGEFWCWR